MGVFIQAPFWASSRLSRPVHTAPKLITPPAIEPLTLAEAKLHCRITHDAENASVARWIRAARTKVENDTGYALLTQTRDQLVEQLSGTIQLPCPPLQSVTSVNSTDTAGVETVWPATNYIVDTASVPGRIALTTSGYWPTDVRWFQSGRIRFVAGWTEPALIPADLLQAMLLLVEHFNDQRGAVTLGAGFVMTKIALGYDELIGPYKLLVVA